MSIQGLMGVSLAGRTCTREDWNACCFEPLALCVCSMGQVICGRRMYSSHASEWRDRHRESFVCLRCSRALCARFVRLCDGPQKKTINLDDLAVHWRVCRDTLYAETAHFQALIRARCGENSGGPLAFPGAPHRRRILRTAAFSECIRVAAKASVGFLFFFFSRMHISYDPYCWRWRRHHHARLGLERFTAR